MIKKLSFLVLVFCLGWTVGVRAEEPDPSLENAVARMQAELHLTDAQALEVKLVFEEAMGKFEDFQATQEGQLVIDHENAKRAVQKIKDEEKEKLSKILSADQMKDWARRQRIRENLNKDKVDFSESLGGAIGAVSY